MKNRAFFLKWVMLLNKNVKMINGKVLMSIFCILMLIPYKIRLTIRGTCDPNKRDKISINDSI